MAMLQAFIDQDHARSIVTKRLALLAMVSHEHEEITTYGEREVQQVLRRALLKYRLHTEQELFEEAYRYIREYY
jgi:type I restriction enzyme R subunit